MTSKDRRAKKKQRQQDARTEEKVRQVIDSLYDETVGLGGPAVTPGELAAARQALAATRKLQKKMKARETYGEKNGE